MGRLEHLLQKTEGQGSTGFARGYLLFKAPQDWGAGG